MAESRIQGLSIGLNLETAGIDRSLTDVKRSFKGLNASIKTNSNNMKYGEKSIASYEQNISTLNSDIEKQRKNLDDVGQKYKEAAAEGNENSAQAQQLAEEYNKQADNLNRLEHQLGSYKSELEEMKRQQEIANSGWTKMGTKLQDTGSKISDVGGKVSGFGKQWTKVTGIIAGAVTGAGAAVFGFTNKITQNAEEISNQSDQMGVSTDFYQEMDYWAKENGMSQEGMEKSVRRLNQRMGEAKDGNEKYSGALEKLGISMSDVKDGTISTEDAYIKSIESLSDMENSQEQAALAGELFGKKTSQELLPALKDGSMTAEEAAEQFDKLGGGLSEKQIEQAKKFQGTFTDIKTAIKGVAIDIGSELMPYMQGFLDYIRGNIPQIRETITGAFQNVVENVKGVVNWFMNLSSTTKRTIGIFAGVAAALGPVSIALGGLMKVFGPVVSSVGSLFTMFGKLGGVLPAIKVGLTALTGPVGITVAAVAGLTAGIVTAYNKSESFRNVVHGLKDAFLNAVSGIQQFFTTNETVLMVVDGIKQAFSSMKTMVTNAIRSIVSFFQSQITKMKLFWDENGQQIKQAFINIFKGIRMVVEPVIKAIVGAVKLAMPVIKKVIKTTFTTIKSITQNIWNGIKGVINGVLEVIRGVIKTFSGLFTGDFKQMWSGIKSIFKGALNIIKSVVKTSFNNVKAVTKGIWNGIKSFFSSIWKGIKGIFKSVIGSVVSFVKNRFNTMKSNIKGIFNGIKNVTKSAWNGVKEFIINPIKSGVKWAIDKFTSFKNTVGDKFGSIKDGVSDKVKSMIGFVKDMPKKMAAGVRKGYTKIKSAMEYIGRALLKPITAAVDKITYGVGWVLEKVGATKIGPKFMDYKVEDHIPGLAKGTDNHEGGPAIVSDGSGPNKQELINTPDGNNFLSPKRETMMNLPKGTSVLDGNSTAQVFENSAPAYAGGIGWLKTAWEKGKNFVKKAKDIISHPLKAVKGAISKYVKVGGAKGAVKSMIPATAKKVYKEGKDWFKEKIGFHDDSGGGGMDVFGSTFNKTSGYGNRSNPTGSGGQFHHGIDYSAPLGTSIKSATSGRMKQAGFGKPGSGYGGYGNVASVMSNGFEILYTHLSKLSKKAGQKVKAGDKIGEVGTTGDSTGPHVHFEARKNGELKNTVNPNRFLKAASSLDGGSNSGKVGDWISKGMKKAGASGGNWKSGLDYIIGKESSGDPKAVGAMTSSGTAKGLMQLKDMNMSGNAFDPINNIVNGIKYIKDRYNGIGNAVTWHKAHNWYKQGTNYVPEDQPAMLHKGEAVVPKEYNQQPTQAMKLLAIIGKKITNSDNLSRFGMHNDDMLSAILEQNKMTEEQNHVTKEQNELLRKILFKDNNTYLDGRSVALGTEKFISEIQDEKAIRRRRARGDD